MCLQPHVNNLKVQNLSAKVELREIILIVDPEFTRSSGTEVEGYYI